MAGPGFQLGSFSTGLFGGAQSVLGLYKEYQGIRNEEEKRDALKKYDEELAARKRDGKDNTHKVEGNQDFTKAPGQTAPTQTPASTPTSAPEVRPDILTRPPEPAEPAYPPAPLTEGEIAPSFRGQDRSGAGTENDPFITGGGRPRTPEMVGGLPRSAYPWDPDNPIGTESNSPTARLREVRGGQISPGVQSDIDARDSGQGDTPSQNVRAGLLSTSPPRPASPGMTRPMAPPPVDPAYASPTPPPTGAAMMPDRAATDYRTQANAPPSQGVQSDVDAHGGVRFAPRQPPAWPMTPTNAPVGATLGLGGSSAIPNQSAISNQPVGTSLQGQPAITRTAPTSQPIPGAQGGPYTPPSQQDPRLPQQQGPTAPIPPPTMVGGEPEQGPPTVGGQGNRPYIPPPQREQRDLSSPAIGGPAVQGGVPLAAAQPPSLGGRILSYIPSLMGSAQAAEVAPGGAGRGSADAPVNFPPTGPVTPTPGPNPSAQPSGITPAQPPTQGAPAHPPAGPVVVAGTDGTVRQSQATPPLLAPNPDYGALRRAEKLHPEKLALMDKAIQAEGADGLNRAFVAATIERESKWQSGLTHGTGNNGVVTDAKGMMQVIGSTRDEIDPRHELNPLDDYDSMRLGIRYYKHLAVGPNYNLGYNTVQSAFAYRAGAGHLPEVAAKGWQGYIDSAPNNSVRLERMSQVHDMETQFPGTTLTAAMVPGGTPEHQPVDARGLVQAYHQGGPDGALSRLQETGPAGLGDTDRWRGAQSALEHYLIISGQPEKAGMAAEWVAQVSHQGAVSHLLAADQALLGGDKDTAINHILRSYAFYPDGAYARAGTDKNGDIWVYKIKDGGDGTPLGQPMKVTHELIAQTLIAMRNPQTYVETMDKHRKVNAEIDLHNAQADWARARPEIAALQTESREAIANAKNEAARQLADDRARMAAESKARIAEHNTHLEEESTKLYPADDATVGTPEGKFTAEEYPTAANLYRQLRKHPEAGGANLSSVDAYRLANGLAAGVSQGSKNPQYRLDLFAGADGKPAGYGIVDKSGKVLKTLTYEQGELVKGIVGLAGSAPLKAPGTAPAGPAAPAPTPGITPARPPAPSNTSAPGANMDPAFIPMTGLTRRPLTMAA